ncbi:VanZ family protein [Jeotgalibacillus soli]|uniref:VanZ-like domain-containing protein n=1 Tax=Jeotgalibacillus soli TaxID=889306 RepID=A0A0C2W0Y9_9BACL|nr:VanZ family protein [Jeotgalibacillus soli]KIL49823.1 hypothetical protein KP78_12910 [Jeotgalibacillus soli]
MRHTRVNKHRRGVTLGGILIRLVPFLLFCAAVLYSSSQTYEQQTVVPLLDRLLSREYFREYLTWINFTYGGGPVSIATHGYAGFIEFFIRKLAHVTIFFLIGLFLISFLNYILNNLFRAAITTFFFVVLFAVMDEFHQHLTGGRTPLVQDVILDTIGGLIAIIGYSVYRKWRLRRR